MKQFDKDADRIGRAGKLAWLRLKKTKDWNDWMAVGEALTTGRHIAMLGAGTNKPEGKGYCDLFAQWLTRYKLDEIDKSHRAKLLQLMEHRAEIETWRASLTLHERLDLNHPATVLRKWQKATQVPKPKKQQEPKPDEHAALRAHIEELEASREAPSLEAARKAYAAFLFDMHPEDAEQEITKLRMEIGVAFTTRIKEAG